MLTPGRRWESFDLLRALAAFCVFLFHYGGFVAQWQNAGAEFLAWFSGRLGSVGTNLLLLICGLFVAKSVAQEQFRYRNFLARRIVRIYPPYLMVISSALLFVFLFPRFSRLEPGVSVWRVFLEQLLLWPGIFPSRPMLTVAWTLSWIMAAYVVLPLPLRALRRLVPSGRARIVIIGFLVLAWVAVASASGRISPRISYIIAGAAVYELFVLFPSGGAGRAQLSSVFLLGGIALGLRFVFETSRPWGALDSLRSFLFTSFGLLGVTLLILGAFVLEARKSLDCRRFPLDAIRRFGQAGYSFYMLHGPVTKVFCFVLFPPLAAAGADAWIYWSQMPVCFLFAAAVTAVLYLTVERRLQRLMSGWQPARPASIPQSLAGHYAGEGG